MSFYKRLVKLLASFLAVIILIGMVFGITFAFNSISYLFGTDSKYKNNIKLINEDIIDNIDNFKFKINLEKTNVTIVESNEFNINTNNRNINVDYDNNEIIIEEKKMKLFNYTESYDMTISVPNAFFKEVSIVSKSGNITIDKLMTNKLTLETGAGKTVIKNLTVFKEANISSGVGKLELSGNLINNMTLSSGVGESVINTVLAGNAYISSGVGNVYFNINQGINHYHFNIKKGIGNVIIDDKKQSDDKFGNGPYLIDISSGIGEVNFKFVDEEEDSN